MITHNSNIKGKKIKAVGLLSGGLDSTLACKLIADMGIEVHGVFFSMPWGCCEKGHAQAAADRIGIKFIVLQLDERYLEMIRKPRYGYGSAMNPCVDCRIHMFRRAAKYMKAIEAEFLITGEVLGQRPMSQLRKSLGWIERDIGLQGRLVRPLSAHHFEPTIPEQNGMIDRDKLLKFSGRGRRDQLDLAAQFGITEFSNPAGGCLLTDKHFARRLKDSFQYGYRNFKETVALKWGRHFRISEQYKAILGRDKFENESLINYADPQDHILKLPKDDGPTCILKGPNPSNDILELCAGLIQRYSKYREETPIAVHVKNAGDPTMQRIVNAKYIPETKIEEIQI